MQSKDVKGLVAETNSADQDLFAEAHRLYQAGRLHESFSRYTELAEKGYPSAQVFLGWMCNEGVGQLRDQKQAMEWFRRAAERGSAEGMFYCGRLLEEVGKYDEAFEQLRQSAGRDYAPALCRVGLMYLIGRGPAKNHDYALQYLRRASEHGNVFAKRELAVMQIRNGISLFDRVLGAAKFVQAVVQSFIIAWRDPYSERLRC